MCVCVCVCLFEFGFVGASYVGHWSSFVFGFSVVFFYFSFGLGWFFID